jgi:PmbA protein
MEDRLRKAARQALDYAARPGVEAEVYGLCKRVLQIEVARQQVETLKDASEKGLGIRIINRGRLGFAYTTDIDRQAIEEAVQSALEASIYMAADEHLNLTPPGMVYPQLRIFDTAVDKYQIEEKIALARQMETAARDADRRITIIERSGYEQKSYEVTICNSLGLNVNARGNYCGLYLYAVAEQDGDAQGGFASKSCRNYADLDPEAVAGEASRRALRSLKARSMASQCLPCILEPYVAVKFLSLLARMMDAEAVSKGKSLLADKIGEAVAANLLTVVDDATLDGGLATFPFDDEGVPAQQHTLIKQGVLQGFLYDNYNAHKTGLKSTGHAMRMSFRSLPAISPSNLMIQAGAADEASLIGSLAEGLYVTDIMGMHTANPVSGDFSLGATGIVIKQGRLTYPVRGLVIAGNMIKLLQDIDALGTEVRFFGSRGAPSLRVASLSVAGS